MLGHAVAILSDANHGAQTAVILNPPKRISSGKGSQEKGAAQRRPPVNHLSSECEMANPVLLPALFVVLRAERLFFAETDCLDAVGGDALLHEHLLYRFGPTCSEGQVVFFRAPVIAMPFDEHANIRMLRKEGGVLLRAVLNAGAGAVQRFWYGWKM